MNKRILKKKNNIEVLVQKAVNEAFTKGFASVLNDIEYRIETLMDVGIGSAIGIRSKVNSRDLNLAGHILDGYVITDNSPSAGYVAWAGCNIVYKGSSIAITDGNTNSKYIWWDFSASPNTVFQTSATMPALTDDDCLIAINDGGKHSMNIGEGRATHGATIESGTVTGTQIGKGAVGTGNIANSAITNALLATGAVDTGNMANSAITATKIASGAVGSSQIAASAVGSSQLATGAVTNAKIGTGAVTSGNLGTGAVTSTAIAADAVTSNAIADGAVGSSAIAANAVTATQIGAGAVTTAKIGAGAVASNNLNLAQHLLY